MYFRLAEDGPGRRAGPAGPGAHRSHRSACWCATGAAPRPCSSEREAAAQAYFQAHAGEWDSIRALHVAEAEVEAAVAEALGAGPFDLFVDLGTGTGPHAGAVRATRFRRGLGLDLSPAMLAYARAKLERAGLPHAQVRQGDIYDLPLADQTRRRGGHAPGAALPERSAARHPRGGARAGAGRAAADRRFRAARAGIPARAVRARAARLRRRRRCAQWLADCGLRADGDARAGAGRRRRQDQADRVDVAGRAGRGGRRRRSGNGCSASWSGSR